MMKMTRKEYADFLLPNVVHDVEYYESKYPERNLPKDAIVVRVAPSPTGFVHFGTIFQGKVNENLAKNSQGVFMLRIEDTDQKREVENGIEEIMEAFKHFEIVYNEGPISKSEEKGEYGPYIQSQRKDIYQAYIKYMIEQDMVYPSFTTAEELETLRKEQEKRKERIGYYGRYAIDRNLTMEEVIEKVKNKEEYVFRLKSPGHFSNKRVFEDLVKGEVEFPENDIDYILLKSDGLPTYHFAHVIDDHLMHTTHITRGDEWLSSLPLHIQIFEMLKFPIPKFAHIAPIMKEENGKRRKISKRKDPEANVFEFKKRGFPIVAVKEYLMTVANSNFEEWSFENPDKDMDEFIITFDKMNVSGALFDMEKLLNLSKNYLSTLTAEEVYENLLLWAKEFDPDFATLITEEKERTIKTLDIERNTAKPRKDFALYSEIKDNVWYMYESLFKDVTYDWQKITDIEEIKKILQVYMTKYYDKNDDNDAWFDKVKQLCEELGYAANMKDYKKNPEQYKGNVADVSTVIRVAVTSSSQTPNLCDILKILGKEEIERRINML